MSEVALERPEERVTDLDRASVRGLVPTSRQSALGITAEEGTDVPAYGEERRRPTVRSLVRTFLKGYDLRELDGPKLPIVVFFTLTFFAAADSQALAILLPDIRNEFNVGLTFLLTLGNVLAAVNLAMAIPLGYLADRWNRIWMLRIGQVAGATSLVAQAFATSAAQLFVFRGAAGVVGTLAGPVQQPLMSDYYKPSVRARAFALLTAGQFLGPIVGVLAAGFCASRFGWRYTLFGIGALTLAGVLLTFLLKEPRRGEVDRLEAGMSEEEASRDLPPMSFGQAIRTAWAVRTLRYTIAANTVFGVATTIQLTIQQLYLAEYYQLGPTERAVLTAISLVSFAIGLGFSGPLIDRLTVRSPNRILALSGGLALGTSAMATLMWTVPPLWLVFGIGLAFGVVAGAAAPAGYVLISVTVPPRVRGLALQIGAPFILASLIVMQVAIGVIGDDIRTAWLVIALVTLVSGLIQFAGVPGVDRDVRAARAANAAELASEQARTAGQNKMLVLRDVDVTYGSVQVLFGIDLDVAEGEILALLGTNGAGKSTVLRAICGLQPAYSGAIFMDGQDITYAPTHENAGRGIVMMPGGQAVFPALTVAANLRAAAHLHREDDVYVREQTERVLDTFPVLRERLDQLAGSLSGGEQQQLALGQAFLMKPRLLMIDELSLGLAPAVVERLLDTLREIHAAGTTIILVEQSVNVALTVAQRAVFMDKGAIEFDGPTEELLRRPDLLRSVFMGAGAGGGAPAGTRRRSRGYQDEAETVLQVEGVGVAFGGIHALRDVSMRVDAGEVVGIIGPNGAGKTTLFDCISGFVTPDTGRVVVGETDVSSAKPDVRARLGLTRSFQNARLFPSLTVREAIAAAYERKSVRSAALAALWTPAVRRSERKLDRFTGDLIERLGLTAYADKFVGELSTGTRRAVDVACVLALEPKVLLLDEPTSGLAQAETEALGPLIRQIVRESGCGVLVIEHDIPLVTGVSDRLYAMELGQVIATGTPAEVVSDPRVLASYLSASDDVIQRSDSASAVALASALGQPAAAPSPSDDPA